MALSASQTTSTANAPQISFRERLTMAFNNNESRLAGSENREIANQIITQVLKNDFR